MISSQIGLVVFAAFLFASGVTGASADQKDEIEVSQAFQVARREALDSSAGYLKRLMENKERVQGLELLVAAGYGKDLYSRWGHAMLRFVGFGNAPMDDLVLSFVADIDQPKVSYFKGMFGGYEVVPLIRPLREFLSDYSRDQGRAVSRHILTTTQGMRDDLLFVLKDWVSVPEKNLGNYTFTNRNCAGLLSLLLRQSEITYQGRSSIPTHLPALFEKNLLSQLPELTIPSWKARLKSTTAKFTIDSFSLSSDEIETRVADLSAEERIFLYLEGVTLDSKVLEPLLRTIKQDSARTGGISLSKVYGLAEVPAALYRSCYDALDQESCIRSKSPIIQTIWNAQSLRNKQDKMKWTCKKGFDQGLTPVHQELIHEARKLYCPPPG